MNRLIILSMAAIVIIVVSGSAMGQALYDSFSDGNFTAAPAWGGTTANWTVVADSDAAAGATGSNTVRLNVPTTTTATEYLSSQIASFGTSQEWGVFFGRRAQAIYRCESAIFWLYANEADLTSATVDGYRLAIGDDTLGDEIRLEYIVNGAVSSTVITSSGSIPNGTTDIGFLVRVTRSSAGVFELFTSALPTANGAGAVATDIPNSTNASVSQGTGTENSLVPAVNGYVGLAALHSTGANARAAAEFDQIYFTPMSATAAGATINGRITDANGRGLKHVVVMMTGGGLEDTIYATTSAFGYYRFEDVPAGNTYVLTAFSKTYSFDQPSIVLNVGGDFDGANFIGQSRFTKVSESNRLTKLK